MRNWLLEAAARARQEEQAEAPANDPQIDPWAIQGRARCIRCRNPLNRSTVGLFCDECRPSPRPRVCAITGCRRPARANGRCRKHLHGANFL